MLGENMAPLVGDSPDPVLVDGSALGRPPRILLIYTGGTIGMVEDAATGALAPFDFSHLLENVPKVGRLGYQLDFAEIAPPIDSSDMSPAHWREIAQMVAAGYDAHDGFAILHGTDTMAYTASALSFMLPGLAKPVILTGSQLPIGEIREDGTNNLITALQIAAARDPRDGGPMVREVAISFGRFLWRGNRATKMSSTDFGAFRSFNYPPLAEMDLHIRFNEARLLRPNGASSAGEGEGLAAAAGQLAVADGETAVSGLGTAASGLVPQLEMDNAIGWVSVFPGMTEEVLRSQLEVPSLKGAVLRTFGAGNAPTRPWFVNAVAQFVSSGRLLVNVTQCAGGGVEDKRYATGDALVRAGVVSGFDMTCEAALAKMMHLFGRGCSAEEAAVLMQRPLAGELTVPDAVAKF